MSSKSISTSVKVLKANPGVMVATLVVGAALATAGWWYSDRLLLPQVGKLPDVNEAGNCKGNTKVTAIKEDGEIIEQELLCDTSGANKYKLKWARTLSGALILQYITDAPVSNAPKYILGQTTSTGRYDMKTKLEFNKRQFEDQNYRKKVFEQSTEMQYDGGR